MRRRMTSVLALVGFAAAAILAAAQGLALGRALMRMVAAALAMGIVGFVAGTIAQKAVREAVDVKMPRYVPENQGNEETTGLPQAEEQ